MLINFEKRVLKLEVFVWFPAKLCKKFYWDAIFVLNFLGFKNEIKLINKADHMKLINFFKALDSLYQLGPGP